MRAFFKTLLGIENTVQAHPLPISTPDITKGQVYAGLQFGVSVAVGAAVLSPAEGQVLIGASGVIGAGIAIADAIIRHGRATAIGQKILAAVSGGSGKMGSETPAGDPLPPAPTLSGSQAVDTTGGGSGPQASSAFERVETARNAPPPPPPSASTIPPEHIAEAEQAVADAQAAAAAAQARLAALRNVTPQQSPQQ